MCNPKPHLADGKCRVLFFIMRILSTGNRKSESLLAHEIAHQWFGDMATEKSFAHLWLSEGFATYLTIFTWKINMAQIQLE